MNRPGSINYQRIPKRNIMVKRTKPKAPTNKALNTKIKRVENNLIELKYKDVLNTASLIPVAGLLVNGMNFTSIGVFPQRSGLEINATSLSIKGSIVSDIDNLSPSRVRMIVFWDRVANGAVPVLAGDNGLLENNVVTNLVYSPRNYKTLDRYKILLDEIMILNPATNLTVAAGVTTQVLQVEKEIVKYVKLSRTMKYDGTAGDITDSTTNTINVAFFGDQATAASQATYTGGMRLYYKD